jgi:hypothetical protein
MKSLKGVPIGLKANMSKEQMRLHLQVIRKQWIESGYEFVDYAIQSKCRPLIIGFYWNRFPEASKRLSEVLQELQIDAGDWRAIHQKEPAKKAETSNKANFLEQFK